MKKRILASLLCAVMTAGVLAGCGGTAAPAAGGAAAPAEGAEASSDAAAPAAAEGGDTLVFTWWGNQTRNERTTAALDLYSEQNPGVTFDAQPAAWDDYWSKLSTAAAGNSLPPLLQMDYSYLEQYVSSGLLADLTPYIESGALDASNISQGIMDSGSVDGKVYAITAGVNAPSLLYNKTLMDELGIEVPDYMSVEQFEDICRQVYEKSGVKADLPYMAADNYLPYLARANGVTALFNKEEGRMNMDDPSPMVDYFKVFQDGYEEGWIIGADIHAELQNNSVEQSPLIYFSSPSTQAWCAFFWSNQMAAMAEAAPDDMEIGITTWPSKDPKASMFLKPSQFFSVSSNAGAQEEAAVKVIDFLTNSVEANEILLGERGVPASSVVADAIAPLQDETAQIVTKYINEVVTPNSSPISPAIPDGANEVYDYANQYIDQILAGAMTAEEAAQATFDKGNEIMASKK
ncbi:MAG TPA: hypothetical protein DCL38_04295 [Lachnospiraceae bacterium]|nr:hypothetical protein [Lachnospiraceae bacterium]